MEGRTFSAAPRYGIFDLDGTLLDSMKVWNGIGELFLRRRGIQPPDDLQKVLQPMSLFQAVQYLKNRFSLAEDEKELMEQISSMVADRYFYEVPLKPGVEAYLRLLRERGSVLCVVTASEYEHARRALDRLEIGDRFIFIMTCTQTGLAKDSPEIFRLAARRLGVSCREVTVFDDALHALQSAAEAGCVTVGVYDDSSRADIPQMQGLCDRYIYTFRELADQLEEEAQRP